MANIPVNFEPFEPNARPETAQPTEEKPEVKLVELEPRGAFRTVEIQLPDGFAEPPPVPAEDFFKPLSAPEPVLETAPLPAAPDVPAESSGLPAESPEVLEIQPDTPKGVELADERVLETSSERLPAVASDGGDSGMLSPDESIKLLMDLAVLQEDLERAREQTQLAKRHVELVQEQLAKVTAEDRKSVV